MTDLGWLAVTLVVTLAYVLLLALRTPPVDGGWSNCYVLSLRLWRRRGGWLLVTRSRYGWWPHMLWSPDLRSVVEWEPTAPKRIRWAPPLWYRGRVRVRRLRKPCQEPT